MLTADQARILKPQVTNEPVHLAIGNAVRSAAIAGRTDIEIGGLLTVADFNDWIKERENPRNAALLAVLQGAGYTVTSAPPAQLRGFIRVSWAV